jgi:hypothetical protein
MSGVAAVEAREVGLPSSDATELWIVHGLDLDGQTAQSDGGTNATLCAGNAEVVGDLEFGDIVGPIASPPQMRPRSSSTSSRLPESPSTATTREGRPC